MSISFNETLNHGRFETWTEKPGTDFYHVTQVHGVEIVSLETLPSEADGMIASWNELKAPLAIKTADCLPVVIEGEKGVVFLHAGWRGLADGILKRPEISMIVPQRAFIGPCIHVCCFEVSPDFKENFKTSPHFQETNGKLFFDLTLEAKDQLRSLYPNLPVDIAPVCTCCQDGLHSFRRNKTPNRNWNLYLKG